MEVFIDRNPPLRAIKAYLAHSAFRELDITLSRKEPDIELWEVNEVDGYEAARIAAVIQLLNPHVKRWRSLSIKTIHLDSIRVALTNCSGIASELVQLKLCSTRNELLDSRALRPLVSELETPNVVELTLGGEVISLATSWTGHWVKSMTGVRKLFLINSTPTPDYLLDEQPFGEEPFSLLRQRFLSRSLLRLQISNVELNVYMQFNEPIRMEQLHKISFHRVYRSTAELILNIQFIAPRLEILEFKPRKVDPCKALCLPFTNRYSNNFPKLDTFRLSDSKDLDEFLPTLRTCKRLYCDNSLYDEDLEMLKAPYKAEDDTDAQWLCPKLYAIEILTCVAKKTPFGVRKYLYSRGQTKSTNLGDVTH